MSVRDESLHHKFAMSIYEENLKRNKSDPDMKDIIDEAKQVEKEFVSGNRPMGEQPQENGCQTVPPSGNRLMEGQPQDNSYQSIRECLLKKENVSRGSDDSSWAKLSDVGSVVSINSETTEKPKFTIYRYKNRDYKIPTTIMENFDYPGEVVDYIKDCVCEDNYDDEEDNDNNSSLCSNKDVYQ